MHFTQIMGNDFVVDSRASYHLLNEKYEKYMTDIKEIPELKIV